MRWDLYKLIPVCFFFDFPSPIPVFFFFWMGRTSGNHFSGMSVSTVIFWGFLFFSLKGHYDSRMEINWTVRSPCGRGDEASEPTSVELDESDHPTLLPLCCAAASLHSRRAQTGSRSERCLLGCLPLCLQKWWGHAFSKMTNPSSRWRRRFFCMLHGRRPALQYFNLQLQSIDAGFEFLPQDKHCPTWTIT